VSGAPWWRPRPRLPSARPTAPASARPIDPFSGSRSGRYEDDVVVVVRGERLPRQPALGRRWTAVTRHFVLGREGPRLLLVHALPPVAVDNEVAALLAEELFAPGWAYGAETFERLMTGLVLTCHDDPMTAWEGFYRATLDRLDGAGPGATGFAPVYVRAADLVRAAPTRTLLDLGTCFGFFPLLLATGLVPGRPAARPRLSARAADISCGAATLLRQMSARLGVPLPVLVCDAARVPLPDGDADTVTVLHLLEHVDAGHGERIIGEAARLARRRVVVAVPLETEPDAAFGHVRTVSLDDLARSGRALARSGPWRSRVEEHHGGWLVLDRPRVR